MFWRFVLATVIGIAVGIMLLVLALALFSCSGEPRLDTDQTFSKNLGGYGKLYICGRLGAQGYWLSFFDHAITEQYPQADWMEPHRAMKRCLDEAATCGDVDLCQGASSGEPCDEETFVEHCHSDVAVTCQVNSFGESVVYRWDCAQEGPNNLCYLGWSGRPTCSVGTCPGAQAKSTCSGTVSNNCVDEVLWQTDCASLGLECKIIETWYGTASMCTDGTPCDGLSRCDGRFWVDCEHGFEGTRLDCRWLAPVATCVEEEGEDGPEAECRLPVGQELCFGSESHCEGDRALFCLRGTYLEVDCAQIEGGRCVDASSLDAGKDGITCTVPK